MSPSLLSLHCSQWGKDYIRVAIGREEGSGRGYVEEGEVRKRKVLSVFFSENRNEGGGGCILSKTYGNFLTA